MSDSVSMSLDPLFMACSLFRRRKFKECVDTCSGLLEANSLDEAAWFLKGRALTEQTYVDEVEMEEEGIAELFMDDNVVADVARPGTSLRPSTSTTSHHLSKGVRPTSQSGRPLSGFLRPSTQGNRLQTMEQAIRTPRTAMTARPVTTASGRHVRLGTASMLTEPGGPFIDVSKINMNKYARKPALAKTLFEYLFHHESNVRSALELAAQATEVSGYEDWWWKLQLGKCYYRLGLFREAESQFKSTLKHFSTIDMFLFLGKVYVKLDQPNNALKYFKKGLERFQDDTALLVAIARIHEGMGDLNSAVDYYKQVLKVDPTSVEAIACIGTHHFYNDQPEIALRFYRRLLQMGVHTTEVFTNLGLCCFYAQQYDMSLQCFQRALALATDELLDDVWYNIGQVALCIGNQTLAYRCFKLVLNANNDHAEAYNNLGVLEWRRGRGEQALACFQSSCHLSPHLYEPHYNTAIVSEKMGDIQSSYKSVQKSLEAFPDHVDSQELLESLKQHFVAL